MKEIYIEYKYTPDEAVTAMVEASKTASKISILMPLIGGVIVIYCIVAIKYYHQPAIEYGIFSVSGIFLLLQPFFFRWVARFKVKKNPSFNNSIRWRITDSEIHSSTEGSETRFIWDKIVKIHERKGGFLICFQSPLARWIPKHGFQNETQIELFREIARSKPLKYIG